MKKIFLLLRTDSENNVQVKLLTPEADAVCSFQLLIFLKLASRAVWRTGK